MATTKLNQIILEAARRLKDERSDPSSGGDAGASFNSALLQRYANRSVRDFLLGQYGQLGEKMFPLLFPEYLKTSGNLSLVSGSVIKPTDAWYIVSLITSDLVVKYEKLKPEEVDAVRTGKAGLLNATSVHPKFWEEGETIKTLPATNATVVARYIKTHQDIVVSTAAVGNGNYRVGGGTWTAATKTLTATMISAFVSGDVNKRLMFKDAATGIVYLGYIGSITNPTTVVLHGDGLPGANITSVDQALVSDLDPDGNDLILNQYWHGEIVNRMIELAMADAAKT